LPRLSVTYLVRCTGAAQGDALLEGGLTDSAKPAGNRLPAFLPLLEFIL
jgi:hypothetical protein